MQRDERAQMIAVGMSLADIINRSKAGQDVGDAIQTARSQLPVSDDHSAAAELDAAADADDPVDVRYHARSAAQLLAADFTYFSADGSGFTTAAGGDRR
ncbi:hypothetical protein [Halobaculum sp. D14]|uniref:hypothetical protein n=1 Tax=Halobaculum sp. D14 TaxID=3421642 RepID=UPI003EBB211B